MIRLLPYLAAVAVVLGALAFAYHKGVEHESARWELRYAEAQLHAAEITAAAEKRARDAEHRQIEITAAIEADYNAKREADQAQYDQLIADLRGDVIRVRDRFRCATAAAGGVPKAATGSAAPARPEAGGLQDEDVRFLISESARADRMTIERNECVALLNRR